MKVELKEKMHTAIKLAQGEGADQADLVLSRNETLSLGAEQGKLSKCSMATTHAMGLRVIKDQKIGICYSEDFSDAALEEMAKGAVENATWSRVNIHESIKASENKAIIHKVETPSASDDLDWKKKISIALEEEAIKAHQLVNSAPYNGLSSVVTESYYLNSENIFCYENDFYQAAYTSALAKEKNKSGMHYESRIFRDKKNFDLAALVNDIVTVATDSLKAITPASGSYPVVFDIDKLSSLFGCFSGVFSGKMAWEGKNPWADKMNQVVMHPALSVTDSAQDPRAMFHSFFDAEGFAHRDCTLIENGLFKSMLHNQASASYFNVENTFHASRGPKSSLSVAGTNTFVTAKEVTGSLPDRYLLINRLDGLHSGTNAITGDFSLGAHGYIIEGDKRTPISGLTVAGNFFEALKNLDICETKISGNTHKSFFAPLLCFNKMAIAGS